RFRQAGNNPYDTYVIYCRPMTRSIVADKHVANKASKEFQKQFINFATPPVWQKGKIYKLQIEYVGNTCKVFIDGMLYAYFMDQLAPLDKGELAVMLSDSAKLHKMVVHKYDEKMEVKDAEIQYQTPPERGAVNGKEQAFWGLRTQGEPAIVFDMGKKTFIREIHISYNAIPAQNFTSAILSASNSGKDYQAVCSIPNHFAERVRKACDLSAEVNAVGRYFKLTFQRSKFDNAVEVGSVRFFSGEMLASLISERQNQKMARQRPKGLPAADYENNNVFIVLKHGSFEAAICRTNGAISGIRGESQELVSGAYDRYFAENLAGVTEAVETEDCVKAINQQDGILTVQAENTKLTGIQIVKQYYFSPDGQRLLKQLTFLNSRKDEKKDLFLTVRSHVLLNPDYRRGGTYFGADWGLGGRMPAEKVLFDTANMPHAAGNSKIGFFVNPNHSENIGAFLAKVNKRPVSATITLWYEKENIPITYTADGWKTGLATLHLLPEKETSVEYQFMLF
ncbi:MAG: hypothetical protein IKZ84_14345, partial [Victivallales bacterium]|nr:hypothetical protein [Victivallales bacterium]